MILAVIGPAAKREQTKDHVNKRPDDASTEMVVRLSKPGMLLVSMVNNVVWLG